MEPTVRRSSGRSTGQGQRVGEAEHEAQEDRGGAGHGHRRTEGDRLKKMVGPSGRRRAVGYLVSLSTYSERRACRLMGQSRSTQRYQARPVRDRDRRLRARVIELARQHPRYGHRRLTHELRRGSWKVNRKCVRRICREEGLKIVRRAKKRRRLGQSKNGVMKLRAERRNHVWSYDFVFDQLENGRALKILPIVDNFTRECLHIETAHNITGERIVEILKDL